MTDTPGIASDHALLLAAICAGKARYITSSFPDLYFALVGIGELGSTWTFSIKSMDEYGCPILNDELRAALTKTMEVGRVQNLPTAE